MRVTCKCCGKSFDLANREVLEMAGKLQAGRKAAGPEANGNVVKPAKEAERESIALRFAADKNDG